MPYFGVDDGFAFHPKAIRAGNAALGLWVRSGSYCNQQLTDGFVPSDIVSVLGTPTQAKRLVAVGLWVEVEGGYQFHEWSSSGRNFTRQQVLDRRRKDAEKKARARAAKSGNVQVEEGGPEGTVEGVPEGDVEGGIEGVVATHPIPSHPNKKTSSSSGRKRSAKPLPDDWKPTETHEQYAQQNGLDLSREAFKFRHHASANDRRQANWNSSFSTWLANAADWSSSKRSSNYDPKTGRAVETSGQRELRRDPKTGMAVDW